jgi:hypothetical protein
MWVRLKYYFANLCEETLLPKAGGPILAVIGALAMLRPSLRSRGAGVVFLLSYASYIVVFHYLVRPDASLGSPF